MDAVDQDNSKTIEYSEFLAHSLTRDQLSDHNIKLFFDQLRPGALFLENAQSGGESEVHDPQVTQEQGSSGEYIDAQMIHAYFQK